MPSRFVIASARCAPIVSADGSLNCAAAGVVSVELVIAAPAGEGVEGTAATAEVLDGAGAAGGAGVAAEAGAGVDGAFEEDAADAGAALGYKLVRI